MNEAHIKELAWSHAGELAAAREAALRRGGQRRGEIFHRDIPATLERLREAATRYCAIYNEAFGEQRLVVDANEGQVNVMERTRKNRAARIAVDYEARQIQLCAVQIGNHRHDFSASVSEQGDRLMLIFNGFPTTEDQLITTLLDRFTITLTEIECAEA